MKRNAIYVMLVMAMCLLCSTAFAQTYAYRLIKMVSRYGEVREVGNQEKIFITFVNNKSSFFVSKRDGSRAGQPTASTGYAIGFNNASNNMGYGDYSNPQNFNFSRTEGGIHIYTNSRPIMEMNSNFAWIISGYVTDYAKFNSDFSRINVIPSPDGGSRSVIPFGIVFNTGWPRMYADFTTFVYEQVQEPNVSSQEFY